MKALRVVVLLSVVGLFALLASSASAVITQLPDGKAVSYFPVPGKRSATAARRPHVFDFAFSNLDYNGGPVMSSNTDYALYWRPSTATAYPSDYKSGINTYFEALAHDSGGHQNADSVAAQYNDAAGEFANYDVKFGGELVDEEEYPASGCSRAPICLTDEQIQAEVARYVAAHDLPTGLGVEYFVLTPENVESCFEPGAAEVCSANSSEPFYCAYHSDIPLAGGGVILYANDPFVNEKNCDKPGDHINGSSDSALFGGLSHEHLESVTDPEPNSAWTDNMTGETTGYEMADKCDSIEEVEFGKPLGTVEVSGKTLPFNQEIDGQVLHPAGVEQPRTQMHSALHVQRGGADRKLHRESLRAEHGRDPQRGCLHGVRWRPALQLEPQRGRSGRFHPPAAVPRVRSPRNPSSVSTERRI
ncbi:MAG TPA: hypothetical protein VK707_01375 [Solirubrobacteraceae bacterium]|nr:hypothetical protein [Solirubrobacteraceae bacterium]